jgi:hypothetical protein
VASSTGADSRFLSVDRVQESTGDEVKFAVFPGALDEAQPDKINGGIGKTIKCHRKMERVEMGE